MYIFIRYATESLEEQYFKQLKLFSNGFEEWYWLYKK